MKPLFVDARVVIPLSELSWNAVRSSGPGGQNVNKVSTKVELRFDLAGSTMLSPMQKARLRSLAGKRIDTQGFLRVTSQLTRDQTRNLEDARNKLASLIRAALIAPVPRKPTKPSRSAKRKRMEGKRLQGDKKRLRRNVSSGD